MREFPKARLTSIWIVDNIRSFDADEWIKLRDMMRARSWGGANGNKHIEWFLWGALPRETKRELEHRGVR